MTSVHPATGPGGIVTLAALESQGFTAVRRSALLTNGDLVRLRNGWFAARGADVDQVRAVRLGGRLTCVSALRQYGIWVMPDSRLHVAVSDNASRLRSPDDRRQRWHARPDVCLHWNRERMTARQGIAIDTVPAALTQLILCTDRNSALVAIESALNGTSAGRPQLTRSALAKILSALPHAYAGIADLVDASAQSGLETLARLRLRRRGLRVRTQVQIPRVGRVDVLIGERLVLELDSRAHHLGDNYEKDRTRDLELFRQGFCVLRVSYHRAMFDWESVEEVILLAVRRGDHLRRAMHYRLGLASL
jgi:very-short-patch-repair endonuclease